MPAPKPTISTTAIPAILAIFFLPAGPELLAAGRAAAGACEAEAPEGTASPCGAGGGLPIAIRSYRLNDCENVRPPKRICVQRKLKNRADEKK